MSKYIVRVTGFADGKRTSIIKYYSNDLSEAIDDMRKAFDYLVDDYDRIICKVKDKTTRKLLFCEHN